MTSNARELAQIPSAPSGRRNLIINGAMQIAQRSESTTGVGASAGYFTVDRFRVSPTSTDGRLTMSQDSDAPEGFANSLKLDCTTADTSIASGEAFLLITEFEGQDVQRLAKGTSSAKEVTLSFYAKANASKTYVVELKDIDNTRTCSKTFTVGTSYTRHEITFPADTTGALDDDNAKSLAIHFWLHAGSDYTGGTLQTAWGAQSNADRAAGIDSIFSSTDNTFFITGLQLEVGSVATEFEHRSFGEELALCQRYYQSINTNARTQPIGFGHRQATNTVRFSIPTPVALRADPSISISGTVNCQESDGSATETTSISGLYNSNAYVVATGTVSGVVAGSITMQGHSGTVQIDAEL